MSFIDNCFKTFVDKLFMRRPQARAVEKKTLFLSLPYLGEISLQTRTKLRKSFKNLLNSCKLQIVFKSQRKLSNVFRFKDPLHFDLVSGVASRFYLTGDMTNLYLFIKGSSEWPFRKLFSANASLWNQHKYIVFNIFSSRILIISYKMLIITGISNERKN